MKIKEITIKWFRSIKDELHIKDFWSILSLVWKNNSWKSSILNALRLFWGHISPNPKDFTYWVTSGPKIITITILFENINKSELFKYSLLTLANLTRLANQLKTNFYSLTSLDIWDIVRKIENLDLHDDELDFLYEEFVNLFKIEINADNNIYIKYVAQLDWKDSTFLYFKESWEEDKNYFKKEWKPTLLFIWDNRKFEEEENSSIGSLTSQLIKDLDIKKEEIQLSTTSSINIESLEKLIENKFEEKTDEVWIKISDNFKKYYKSDFNEVKLESTYSWITQSNFKIKAQIKEPITWEFIDLNNLWAWLRSIYILSLLKAYNDLKQWNNTIIIIEEPELYLHPELQKEMSWTLNEISKEHTVFFTTHSPLLLNKLNIENIRNIYFHEVLKTTKIQYADMEIICNDLWYNSLDIINKEKILFVEGTSDITIFEILINKFYNWVFEKIKIIASSGCSNLPKYATLNFVWDNPMLLNNSIVIIDRDYQSRTSDVNSNTDRISIFKSFLSKFIKPNVVSKYTSDKIYITEWHSMENMFLDFSIINSIFTWINLDEAMIRREFRTFANWQWYFDSNSFKSHFDKINKIPWFFDGVENWVIDLINIRWHNLMHYLIYKCYWWDYANITTENELDFCMKYIDESTESNFQWLLDFFNGIDLFNDNRILKNDL